MARLHESRATLRIMGDNLDPDEVTRLLGAEPTAARRKGEAWHTPNGREMIARSGIWRLTAAERQPEDLDGQVSELLGRLSSDLDVWQALACRFRIDLFCGWFMEESNEDVWISPGTLAALGARGIELGLDIYDGGSWRKNDLGARTRSTQWDGTIRLATEADAKAWLALRIALWPEADPGDLRDDVVAFFEGAVQPALLHKVFFAEAPDGVPVGMLELSLRPYADGCESSPVPFIEGWYVAPEMQRRGIGGALMHAAEQWALAERYEEMASDALLGNRDSRKAHAALGFEEVERAVRFRKSLKD